MDNTLVFVVSHVPVCSCCVCVCVCVCEPLTLDGDDELGDDREDLGSAVLQHVVNTLTGEELVGVDRLTQPVKEQRQVVVIVQLLYLHLGEDTHTHVRKPMQGSMFILHSKGKRLNVLCPCLPLDSQCIHTHI